MWSKEKEVHEVSRGGLHVDAEAEKGRSSQAVQENNCKPGERAESQGQKLERLETKVIFDCVIGKLRVCRNYYNHKNDNFLDCDWFKKFLFFH